MNQARPAHPIHIHPERAVAFIVARLSSSRFAAKQLQKIGGRSILSWIIDSLRQCHKLDEIVIATVNEAANIPLRELAAQEGLPCFWYEGEIDHVTTRLRKAAEKHSADICLLISADCPLIYAPAIDQLISELRAAPEADHLSILPNGNGQLPALEGVQVARLSAWQRADDLADRPELKEHQFPLIWLKPELFQAQTCRLAANLYAPAQRFSVDTHADLDFMIELHDRLEKQERPFNLPEVLNLMKQDPDLAMINAHVHQRRLVEPDHKALFIVDCGTPFGCGHLMRSLELADQLTERCGWPVTFMIDDEKTADLLQKRGRSFVWGAFARQAKSTRNHVTTHINEHSSSYSLLLIDIFDQRGPEPGWRKKLPGATPISVMDNRRDWAAEADLIITPGVTAAPLSPAFSRTKITHICGAENIILRREIRRARAKSYAKNLDLLVYLHDPQKIASIKKFATDNQLRCTILDSFTKEMPRLMAQAHFFISGFGISFYEALVLNTTPVCWPDSNAHRNDALNFYRHFNLPDCLLASAADLEQRLLPLIKGPTPPRPQISDGTPRLVNRLARLVAKQIAAEEER
ncbi:MAG: NTP transferase domain-containing protein [Geopsychrobacter sp.]|nr:NTP transferase domain-containing protein [Geopsychrobacter sp.]